jgi:tetratricopeptide (TPR) repeat protein
MPKKKKVKKQQLKSEQKSEEASLQKRENIKAGHDKIQKWVLMGIVLLLYANSLTLDYALDDAIVITGNSFTKQGISGIPDIFSYDTFVGFFSKQKQLVAGGRYRPLSLALFAIEYEIFGLNPFIGHLTNLILYAFCCYLIFLVLQMLFRKFPERPWYLSIPFLATALFIAHPLHTEAVTNIKGLDEVMSLLGSVAVLYFGLKYIFNKKNYYLILNGIIFFLALLAKENTITFLAVVPLSIYFFTKAKLNEHIRVIIPLILATIAYLIIRYMALGFLMTDIKIQEILNDPFVNSSSAVKFATVIYTWLLYLKLLIFPHPLTHDYYPMQIPYMNFTDIQVIISLIIWTGLIVYALMKLKEKNIISYAILFFLITFSILSNLVFNIGTFMNERFMFTPLLGFTIIIAWFFNQKLIKLVGNAKTVLGIFILIMLLYSVKTISRNFAWKDDLTLFSTDVKTSTNSIKVNASYGGKLMETSREEENEEKRIEMLNTAKKHLQISLGFHKTYSAAWVLLGNVNTELGNWDEARVCYDNCLKTYTHQPEALARLNYNGQVAFRDGDYKRSVKDFRVLLKHKPNDPDYLFQLATTMLALQRPDTSLVILNSIITTKPDFYQAYSKIGEIYGKNYGDMERSTQFLLKAYELNNKDVSLLENLGVVFGMRANYQRSLEFLLRAHELDKSNSNIMLNISKSYEMLGNNEKAVEFRNKAAQARQNMNQ